MKRKAETTAETTAKTTAVEQTTAIDKILAALKGLEKKECDIQQERRTLLEKLSTVNTDEWDWISVSKAARMVDVSVATVYKKINTRKLETKYIGSKIYVRLSELKAINDVL